MIIACIGVSHITGSGSFSPFFFDWGGYYDEGLIDAAEWKANRFKLI
ncbi:hypothetical protein [Photobacterium angustum]|nr:hypothetical protein [Photobacterium angustum]